MIRPLNDHVVVEIVKPKDTTDSGLYLPQAKEETNFHEAKVVAVGPGRMNKDGVFIPIAVRPGERVLINWGGTDVDVRGNKYRILTEGDILAIIG